MNTLPTIFVVESDRATCESIRKIADVLELRCEVYATGWEFLDAFDPHRPGCMVLEISIPGVNGLEIQQRLVEMGATLPMIFLTASASVSVAIHAMRMGAFHFLEKPPREHDLWLAIHEAIQIDQERRKAKSIQEATDAQIGTLSEKEFVVLGMLADCKSKGAMARELGVSIRAIDCYRTRVMRKLKTDSIAGLMRFALTMKNSSPRLLGKALLPSRHGNGLGVGVEEVVRGNGQPAQHPPQGPAGW